MAIITALTFVISTVLNSGNAVPALRVDFDRAAEKYGVPAKILEGVCRYESDNGRRVVNQNRNGTWDVGLCQNHRDVSDVAPPIPHHHASVKEAAKELAYWKKEHDKYCVKLYNERGVCGETVNGKWRGVKNCHLPHFWVHHYNAGYRVLKDHHYGKKVFCFTASGFRKCDEEEWSQLNLEGPRPLSEINNAFD